MLRQITIVFPNSGNRKLLIPKKCYVHELVDILLDSNIYFNRDSMESWKLNNLRLSIKFNHNGKILDNDEYVPKTDYLFLTSTLLSGGYIWIYYPNNNLWETKIVEIDRMNNRVMTTLNDLNMPEYYFTTFDDMIIDPYQRLWEYSILHTSMEAPITGEITITPRIYSWSLIAYKK